MIALPRARVQLAPGEGRIARRDSALLYVPESDASADLVATFLEARDSAAAAQSVKDFIVDRDLVGPAFLLVQWGGPETIVTVFGDIEAETSSRAAPRLSGVSSMGLIEHRPDPGADFEMSSGDVSLIDPITQLHTGSVLTGPFVLRLAAVDGLTPNALDHQPQSADLGTEVAAPTPTHQPAEPAPMPAQPEAAASTPLVEARICSCSMASPGTEVICRGCGLSIADVEAVVVRRPCVALLELEDGDVIDIDTNLSIGRDPEAQPGFEAVVVDLPGVSRHHVDIVLDGWDILVTDRSSKNGVMLAGEDGVPAQIEPEQAWLVRLGSTLYLGTNQVRVVAPVDAVS